MVVESRATSVSAASLPGLVSDRSFQVAPHLTSLWSLASSCWYSSVVTVARVLAKPLILIGRTSAQTLHSENTLHVSFPETPHLTGSARLIPPT